MRQNMGKTSVVDLDPLAFEVLLDPPQRPEVDLPLHHAELSVCFGEEVPQKCNLDIPVVHDHQNGFHTMPTMPTNSPPEP